MYNILVRKDEIKEETRPIIETLRGGVEIVSRAPKILRDVPGGITMTTKFYLNESQIPVFEIEYKDGERYFLTPFRGTSFQVSMTANEVGAAGSSPNLYFGDIKNCMLIGMNHSDGYWVNDFPVTTLRNIILMAARDALIDHFHCAYGHKHIEEAKDIVNEVCGYDRNSAWHRFICACYEHFGVKTKWDD